MEILKRISEGLQSGNHQLVLDLTKQAIEQKIDTKLILDDGLILGMNVIGEQFRKHEIFLPNVLLAARAMYAGLDQLKPLLLRDGVPSLGKIVIGTVKGDLHDIGKNLVGIMLKGAGFDVIDLGNNVTPEKFVETAQQEQVSIIGMSALLTTTMPVMADVTALLKEKGLNGMFKTIVGGAPLSEEYAQEIGADSYAFDAANAVDRVKLLVE